jgi:hypothetical protein
MNKYALLLLVPIGISGTTGLQAQYHGDSTWISASKAHLQEPAKAGHFMWALHFGQYFSTFKETNAPVDYFTKPSIGGGAMVYYRPFNFVSIGAGVRFQQQGAGIKVPDLVAVEGEPDSTYRTRLRVSTFGIPVELNVHGPKICRGTYLSAGVGAVYSIVHGSTLIYHSVEDGFHERTDMKDAFLPNSLELTFNAGFDFRVPGSVELRVHYVQGSSTSNIYSGEGDFANRSGLFFYQGIRLMTVF